MPDRHDDFWEVLARWRRERRRFVLATVIETRGFTPRKDGTHMLITPAETFGTIGGGAIEHEVMVEARGLLEHGGERVNDQGRDAGEGREPVAGSHPPFSSGGGVILRRHLTRDLGMCCGGEMAVFLELLEPASRLVVFGAGYIAKPLAAVAAACGFEVTVVDERPEWANEERFPMARVELRAPEAFARAWEADGTDFAVVVTHDHALDQQIVQHLLARPLRFLGMIGSVPKQRKFVLRLKARGFAEEAIARLHTPLGLAIGADTPEEIAVSTVAQLIAVRRGQSISPAWLTAGAGTAARPPRTDAGEREEEVR